MRLDEDGNAFKVDFVSIHASVKDATRRGEIYQMSVSVSIHASVKDATVVGLGGVYFDVFQSTHL